MASPLMHLKVVLPSAVFLEVKNVQRMVVETPDGAFGLLPRRLDCVSSLVPGIISYETAGHQEAFIAVDEGVMVKHDHEVLITVRRAFASNNLELLQQQLSQMVKQLSEEDANQHQRKQRLETGFLRRFAEFRDA